MPHIIAIAALAVIVCSVAVRWVWPIGQPLSQSPAAAAVSTYLIIVAGVACLALLSIGLFWVFPINLLCSFLLGYFATKHLVSQFPRRELLFSAGVVAMSGTAMAAAIFLTGDPAFRFIAGPYTMLNVAAMVCMSLVVLRRANNDA